MKISKLLSSVPFKEQNIDSRLAIQSLNEFGGELETKLALLIGCNLSEPSCCQADGYRELEDEVIN